MNMHTRVARLERNPRATEPEGMTLHELLAETAAAVGECDPASAERLRACQPNVALQVASAELRQAIEGCA